MTNQSLCEYLFTQNPDAEVKVKVESFWEGTQIFSIKDIKGTTIELERVEEHETE